MLSCAAPTALRPLQGEVIDLSVTQESLSVTHERRTKGVAASACTAVCQPSSYSYTVQSTTMSFRFRYCSSSTSPSASDPPAPPTDAVTSVAPAAMKKLRIVRLGFGTS